MAVSYRASTHVQMTGTVSKPTGTVSGDVMVAAITTAGGVSSAPSGWTQQAQITAGFDFYETIYTKVAGGSEPSSYTWAVVSPVVVAFAGISTYTGGDTTTPISGTPTTNVSSSASSLSVGGITVDAGSMLVMAGSYSNVGAGSSTGLAWSGGGTERWEENYNAVNITLGNQHDEAVASAGATGTRTLSVTGYTPGLFLLAMLALKNGSVGADATVSVGSAAASGLTITATAGTGVTATVSVGTAAASGLTATATAGTGVTGSVSVGSATADGTTVTATAGQAASAVVTVGTATASGLAVTGTAGVGVSATVAVGDAAASGGIVRGLLVLQRIGGLLRTGPADALALSRQAAAAPLLVNRTGSAAPILLARIEPPTGIAAIRIAAPQPLAITRTPPAAPIAIARAEGEL